MDEVKKDLLRHRREHPRGPHEPRADGHPLHRARWAPARRSSPRRSRRNAASPTIKLKNFRSKWVGATEGNLEKILTVIKAIGQVVVIIDEGDRAFGSGDGESGRRHLVARHRAHQGVHVRHVEPRADPLPRDDEPPRQARRRPQARRPPRPEDPVPLLADAGGGRARGARADPEEPDQDDRRLRGAPRRLLGEARRLQQRRHRGGRPHGQRRCRAAGGRGRAQVTAKHLGSAAARLLPEPRRRAARVHGAARGVRGVEPAPAARRSTRP